MTVTAIRPVTIANTGIVPPWLQEAENTGIVPPWLTTKPTNPADQGDGEFTILPYPFPLTPHLN